MSIVIPCFNRERFIGDAINSALNQSAEHCEVIVIDDGSTDASWSVILGYGDQIRAFRGTNRGVSAARNWGIREARGEWIKFLDSDDLLPHDAISELLKIGRQLVSVEFPVGRVESIDIDGQRVGSEKYNYRCAESGQCLSLGTLLAESTQVSMPLFRRQALNEVGGFREDLSVAEDYELMLRLYGAGFRPRYFATVSAFVREHGLERLSYALSRDVVDGMCGMYAEIIHGFEREGRSPLNWDERVGLGRKIWYLGRRVARLGYESEARRLFSLARLVAGKESYVGNRMVVQLYKVFDPVFVERMLERVKH